jgi:hypothetical protein
LDKLREEKETKGKIAEAVEKGRNRPMLLASYNNTVQHKHDATLATAKRFMEVLLESGMPYK